MVITYPDFIHCITNQFFNAVNAAWRFQFTEIISRKLYLGRERVFLWCLNEVCTPITGLDTLRRRGRLLYGGEGMGVVQSQ